MTSWSEKEETMKKFRNIIWGLILIIIGLIFGLIIFIEKILVASNWPFIP